MIPNAHCRPVRCVAKLAHHRVTATFDAMNGKPNDDDAALFRSAIGQVRELAATPAPPSKPKPRPRANMAERDESNARDEFRHALDVTLLQAGDPLDYRRDEVPARVLRRLRNGEYAAQEELDLHHTDVRQAEALLRGFLAEARAARLGCVRIVHGKGLNSESGAPILKNLVDGMLRKRADVLAFHSAPPAQGGTGAVLVLLAKR